MAKASTRQVRGTEFPQKPRLPHLARPLLFFGSAGWQVGVDLPSPRTDDVEARAQSAVA